MTELYVRVKGQYPCLGEGKGWVVGCTPKHLAGPEPGTLPQFLLWLLSLCSLPPLTGLSWAYSLLKAPTCKNSSWAKLLQPHVRVILLPQHSGAVCIFSTEPMLLDSPSFRSSFPSLHSSVISFQPHAFKSQVWVLKGFLLYHDVPTVSQASLYASLPSQADIIKVGRRCHGRWIEEFKSCCFLGEFPLWQGNESQIRGQRMWGEPRVWMVKPLKVLPPNEQLLLFPNNSPWNLTLAWVICLFFGYIYLFIYWWGRRQVGMCHDSRLEVIGQLARGQFFLHHVRHND